MVLYRRYSSGGKLDFTGFGRELFSVGVAMRKGQNTRDAILDAAEQAVLQKGFAATSIDELIAATGITKSGFFYHFKDKADLAKNLFQRYMDQEDAIMDDLFARVEAETSDPLKQVLMALELLCDVLRDIPGLHPGCMVASYCYQHQLFNAEIKELNADNVMRWRTLYRERLDKVAAAYPPAEPVDLDMLADLVLSTVEGGIILSRTLENRELLPQQVMLCRDYIRRIFTPVGGQVAVPAHA